MKMIFLVFPVFILFSAPQSYADNFRCPNGNIVSSGDSISTVEAKCDPPANKSENSGPLKFTAENGETLIRPVFYTEWIYTQGSNLFHYLIFHGGILKEVRTGGFVP